MKSMDKGCEYTIVESHERSSFGRENRRDDEACGEMESVLPPTTRPEATWSSVLDWLPILQWLAR